jgi:hypothetical protein
MDAPSTPENVGMTTDEEGRRCLKEAKSHAE